MTPDKEEEGQTLIVNQADLPRERFSMDELKIQWRILAQKMKSLGKETVYNALTKRDPIVVEDTLLTLEVDNLVQIDIIKTVHDQLTTYLRSSLRNYDIQLDFLVNTSSTQENEVKHLSGGDKFKHLARKHPNLHTLKSVFGLDIEY